MSDYSMKPQLNLKPELRISPPLASRRESMLEKATKEASKRSLPEGLINQLCSIVDNEDPKHALTDDEILSILKDSENAFSGLMRQDIAYARSLMSIGTSEQRKKD